MELDAFIVLLREAHLRREAELKAQFDRSLPFADGMFDRWERARRLGFGEGASVYDSALIYGDVKVGANTWIGPQTLLDGSGGGLTIGAWCSISAGVHVYTHDTVMWALSGGKKVRRAAPVSIGERTYVGSQSVVALGVSIGERCVVAANSFVNADVPPQAIVGGSPARRLGAVEFDGDDIRLVYD